MPPAPRASSVTCCLSPPAPLQPQIQPHRAPHMTRAIGFNPHPPPPQLPGPFVNAPSPQSGIDSPFSRPWFLPALGARQNPAACGTNQGNCSRNLTARCVTLTPHPRSWLRWLLRFGTRLLSWVRPSAPPRCWMSWRGGRRAAWSGCAPRSLNPKPLVLNPKP